MANGGQTGPDLPGMGKHGGRMRNTFANVLSKNQVNYQNPGGAAALPALDPASTANYYGQLAGLYSGYQNQLAALKQQRIGARADFRAQAADIRAQKLGGIAAVQSDAIGRGVLGSSAELESRAGVEGQAAAQLQEARRAKLETLAGTRLAAQGAATDYFMQTQQLEAQKLAQQQELLAQQLQQNLIVSGQETQMDALRAIYEALAGIGTGRGRGQGRGRAVQDPYQVILAAGGNTEAASRIAHLIREGL